MTVWVTPPDEEPQAAEVLAEGKWNSEWGFGMSPFDICNSECFSKVLKKFTFLRYMRIRGKGGREPPGVRVS